ncbi:MAG TPA: hypothetical protein VLE49_22015 [Anaerolineales bacterium]|nr:hypothetical protein [Anaerolineales bacterium]
MKLQDSPRRGVFSLVLCLAVIILAASCSATPPQVANPSPTLALQPVTETPAPLASSTATLVPPTETASPVPATPTSTATLLPSETPTVTQTETPTSPPPSPSGDEAIYVYYVQLDTGGPVACGDSLIALNTGISRTGDIEADVRAALGSLFFKRQWFGKLYNPLYLSNLSVANVSFNGFTGEVSVDLTGSYVRSGDRCDNGRVRAQVWTTIRQFKDIKTVYILLDGNLLGDILSTE